MSDGGILAGACFPQAGKAAHGMLTGGAAGDAVNIEKAQFGEILAPESGMACHSSQRVGAGIAELFRIRLRPNAEAVQNDQKYAFCHSFISFVRW